MVPTLQSIASAQKGNPSKCPSCNQPFRPLDPIWEHKPTGIIIHEPDPFSEYRCVATAHAPFREIPLGEWKVCRRFFPPAGA